MMNTETETYMAYREGRGHQKSKFMLWMVIGYLFLFVFRPYEYWLVLGTLRIERIYMIFMLVMLIASKQTRFVSHPINKAVIGFFLAMLISSVFAFNTSDAYSAAFDYFKLIVFYFVIIMTIKDGEDLKAFVVAYLVIMLMYFGKSAWEFFINDRHWYRMGIKRMLGIDITYQDPNYFAASIAYSLPFWWGMIKYRPESLGMRLLLWFYGGLAIICIIYSGSRSGMVTALLLLLLISLGSGKKLKGFFLLILFLSAIWLVMPDSYKIRFQSIFMSGVAEEAGQRGADASADGRIVGLITGFRTMQNHPILGLGPGNFKYAISSETGSIIGMSAHNLYGQIMGELGLLGVTTFVVFISVILISQKKIRNLSQDLLNVIDPMTEMYLYRQTFFIKVISAASIHTIILLLFNGNFGHNLYRYNFLWVGAMAVIMSRILREYQLHDKTPQAGV